MKKRLHKKRFTIHVFLVLFYYFAQSEVSQIAAENLDTLVLFVGLIVIAPITAYFIYSYKNNVSKKGISWGHVTTMSSALVIGMLFVILDILLLQMIGNVYSFRLIILTFWIAVISFDYADVER